jgi:aryl-alcohol dehydrogenase-like predicted oxidoreductase
MELALGTVQFGFNYGVSNTNGQVQPAEAARILALAEQAGVSLLDTAHAYGTSEAVIGMARPAGAALRIVTKTAALSDVGLAGVSHSFFQSLAALQRADVYALLVHDPNDLLGPDGDVLFAELAKLRQQGLVTKIGVSVYDGTQIEAICARFPIDIVQLPASPFDQRLLRSGHVDRLKDGHVEVHVRSLFLQGLLLMDPAAFPPYFASIQQRAQRYVQALHMAGLSPLAGSLLFLRQHRAFDVGVVGVTSVGQLAEILTTKTLVERDAGRVDFDFAAFAVDDPAMVNPSLWKLS